MKSLLSVCATASNIITPNDEALPVHKTCSFQSLGVSYHPTDLETEEATKTQTSVITVRNIKSAGSPYSSATVQLFL